MSNISRWLDKAIEEHLLDVNRMKFQYFTKWLKNHSWKDGESCAETCIIMRQSY